MKTLSQKLRNLPASPGVYIFYGSGREVLYVGKATSLKDRVNSYFQRKNGAVRPIEMFIAEVEDLKIRKTETVIEAYILEQSLIKKFQPKYNSMGKDDKSFVYVAVTKEDFPRLVILRRTDFELVGKTADNSLDKKIPNTKCHIPYTKVYGPYTSKRQIEAALKILRKIFPYHEKPQRTEKGCLDFQIGLCPGPYAGAISQEDYRRNIRAIERILQGRKTKLLKELHKEMEEYSAKEDYEHAADVRNKIFSLKHIQDMALISNPKYQINSKSKNSKSQIFRVEGYDISNISGKYSVGSMVVFDNSEGDLAPNKNQYRKFRIKTVERANDVGMMEEVLRRRFRNNWTRPNLILLDGGAGHLNVARRVLRIYHLDIPILAVAKGPERKKLDLRSFGTVPEIPKEIIEQIRDEAHRFAIVYHRKLRSGNFR